jgi:hypothetical protein
VTAGFFTCTNLSEKIKFTSESGPGLYAITLIRPGLIELSSNDYQPGLYAGAGFLYRITENNLCFNINAKYHYLFSGTGDDHPIYVFTEKERTGFFQISAGITLATGN